MATFDVTKHKLVAKHSKISDKEKQELYKTYNIQLRDLPKILITDAAIQNTDPKEGDVIKINRASPTAGTTTYYRRVVNA